jgi:hypothetical protein
MSFRAIHDRYRELDGQYPYFTPALATAFLMVFLVLDLQVEPPVDSGFVQEESLGAVLAILQILPVVFFRRAPLAAMIVIFIAFVWHATLNHDAPWTVQFSTLAGVYIVASNTDDRQSLIVLLFTFVAIIGVFGVIQEKSENAIALSLLFAVVWVAGNIVRARRPSAANARV